MAAILLRSQAEVRSRCRRYGGPPAVVFFDQFNRGLAWISARYKDAVTYLIRIR